MIAVSDPAVASEKLVMLRFDGIYYRYGWRSSPVFYGFTWHVPSGRTVVLGPNGAGKSTLLALGASALRPKRGSVRFGELDPSRIRQRSTYRRAVGWMPQQIRAIPGLTVREQVAYSAWLKGMSRASADLASIRAIATVALSSEQDRKASTLSGGQLQRIGLAQALVHDSSVLLLDEPSSGLDPSQRIRFREILQGLPHELPIVVSTHQVDDIDDLFDQVVVLADGRILFEGSVQAFLSLGSSCTGGYRAEGAYRQVIGDAE